MPDEGDGGRASARGERGRKGIQSVETGTLVLEALIGAPGPLSLKAVAQVSGMSASKAHRYLASFLRGGLVVQDPVSGRYDLGSMALRLGLAALNRLDAVQVAGEALVELAEKTERTGLLAVWGERGPTIVRWQRSSRSVVTSLALGSVLPVLDSATGHVFVAFLPRLLTRARIEEERARAAEDGRPVPMEKIEVLIREVRRRRLARVEGNLIPGLNAVSAPVLDHQGEAAAAITVIGSQARMREDEEEQVAACTAGIAAAASARLGFRDGCG